MPSLPIGVRDDGHTLFEAGNDLALDAGAITQRADRHAGPCVIGLELRHEADDLHAIPRELLDSGGGLLPINMARASGTCAQTSGMTSSTNTFAASTFGTCRSRDENDLLAERQRRRLRGRLGGILVEIGRKHAHFRARRECGDNLRLIPRSAS